MNEALLAKRIKAFRLQNNMTLRDVARATGLTEGLLSKVENQHVSPPISTLSRIADALGVPMVRFFQQEDEYVGYVICRTEDPQHTMRKSRKTGYEYKLLAADGSARQFDPFLVRLRPESQQRQRLHHGGDEFVYVLSGTLELRWGNETFTLEAGDSITFDASVPHTSINPDANEDTLFLAVTADGAANVRPRAVAQL